MGEIHYLHRPEMPTDPKGKKELEAFFALVTKEPDPWGKEWKKAWGEVTENSLSDAFLSARDNVRLAVVDLIDDRMPCALAEDYFSSKADIRIPYPEKKTLYSLMKQEMIAQFRESCFWAIFTGASDKTAEKMVVRYLATPCTYTRKKDLS